MINDDDTACIFGDVFLALDGKLHAENISGEDSQARRRKSTSENESIRKSVNFRAF